MKTTEFIKRVLQIRSRFVLQPLATFGELSQIVSPEAAMPALYWTAARP